MNNRVYIRNKQNLNRLQLHDYNLNKRIGIAKLHSHPKKFGFGFHIQNPKKLSKLKKGLKHLLVFFYKFKTFLMSDTYFISLGHTFTPQKCGFRSHTHTQNPQILGMKPKPKPNFFSFFFKIEWIFLQIFSFVRIHSIYRKMKDFEKNSFKNGKISKKIHSILKKNERI